MKSPKTVSWHHGSLDWTCVGRDVPLEEFGPERRILKATYPPARVGHFKHFAPCPKCDNNHWIFIGWEEPTDESETDED